jgi:N-6 DNA Methylase
MGTVSTDAPALLEERVVDGDRVGALLYERLAPVVGRRERSAQARHQRALAGVLRALTWLSAGGGGDSAGKKVVPREWGWFRAQWGTGRIDLSGIGVTERAIEAASIDSQYESLLELKPAWRASGGKSRRGSRRARGSFYTPSTVAAGLAKIALKPLLDEAEKGGEEGLMAVRVCDPACGSGRFLGAAAAEIAGRILRLRPESQMTRENFERVRGEVAARCVFGMDADPLAVELCRFALATVRDHVRCVDGLLDVLPKGWPGQFDAVIGNPPFLNQLESATARSERVRRELAARFGGAIRPYTDTAALFLLRGLEITRRGGRIGMIQPRSFLASRDGAPVRERLMERCALEGLWEDGERVFGAGVRVCAPVLTVGATTGALVRTWTGPRFRARAGAPSEGIGARSWAPLLADARKIPRVNVGSSRTLGEIATATADFRDQFYGLRGCIVEDEDVAPGRRAEFPRLITSGLIEPARCLWGEKECRLLGRRWRAPRADLARIEGAGLGAWARARLVPKVLLATQTRVLEAIVDEDGTMLPVTPVITIVPRDAADVWRVGVGAMSPVACAWAARWFGGAGLSPGAIKLSARQCLMLPIPERDDTWKWAALKFRDHQQARADVLGREGVVRRFRRMQEQMCEAFGLRNSRSNTMVSLMLWWFCTSIGQEL